MALLYPVSCNNRPEVVIDYLSTGTIVQLLRDLHPSDSQYLSGLGQCFTNLDGYFNVTKGSFRLRKTGNPSGLAYVDVYQVTSIYYEPLDQWFYHPTGNSLATTESFDVSTLTTSLAWYDFSFQNFTTLEPNLRYGIFFRNPSSGVIDASNYIQIWMDANFSRHDGNCFSYERDQWGYAQIHTSFYVYGKEIPRVFGEQDQWQEPDVWGGAKEEPAIIGKDEHIKIPPFEIDRTGLYLILGTMAIVAVTGVGKAVTSPQRKKIRPKGTSRSTRKNFTQKRKSWPSRNKQGQFRKRESRGRI